LKTPAVEGQIVDKGAINYGADRPRLGIDQRRAAFHRDGLRAGAHGHLEVDFESILDVQDHIRLYQFLEAGLFNFDAIVAGRKVCQNVLARGVAGRFVTGTRARVDGRDPGIGDTCLGRIGDAAGERSVCGLGVKKREGKRKGRRFAPQKSGHKFNPTKERGSLQDTIERKPGVIMGLMTWPRTLFAGFILASCPFALALNPSLEINQYAHKAWTVRDGFFKTALYSIAQTPDGYLWLGTDSGLLRFDGIRYISWQPPSGESLPSNWIFSLLAAHDGRLWIGTDKGLAVGKTAS
jgi:Two component regulator propeller